MAHFHEHVTGSKEAKNWVVLVLLVNMTFVVVEGFFGWIGHSVALLSDAGHNLIDVLAIALSLLSLMLERARGGRGAKASFYVRMVNTMLLGATVVTLVVKSVDKLSNPVAVDGNAMMVVASVGVVINGLTAYLLLKHESGNVNVRIAYLHALTDSLVSVGVVVSGVVIALSGCYVMDAIAGLIVATVIAVPVLKMVYGLFKELEMMVGSGE